MAKTEDIAVSVYCLAYNHERYIRQALEGFVMQKTSFRYEVFVHDDASTDRTADVIREYAERYPDIIKPIYQTENQYSQGIPIMKTHILPIMKGRYIASCEGDDYWTDDTKLQRQFDALEAHPECSLSTHLVRSCREDGSEDELVYPSAKFGLNSDRILSRDDFAHLLWDVGGHLFQTSSYFYRREIFDAEISLRRDEGILRRCLILGGVCYIDRPMSMRRRMATGSFCYRLVKEGVPASYRLYLSNLDNDLNFDRYTEGRYRRYIVPVACRRIMKWAYYDTDKAREIIRQNDLAPTDVRKYLGARERLSYTLKYAMLRAFPKGLVLWHALRSDEELKAKQRAEKWFGQADGEDK